MDCDNNNCNLTTCRYNQSGTCTNEDKRQECVEVSKKVFCFEDCEWVSILLFPIFYKHIPIIWDWVSGKIFDFLYCVRIKVHHLPTIRRRGKRK